MTVNKYLVAGGVTLGAVAVGAGVVYCRRDFAEAAAAGDFERAERRAGLLALNDLYPAAWLAFGFAVLLVGLFALGLLR